MDFAKTYTDYCIQAFSMAYQKNKEPIQKAAQLCYEATIHDHTLYTFGTGHSHMLGQDLYARAGGYAKIYPIVEIELTLATHPTKSTTIERTAAYADVLEHLYDVKEGDVVFFASNSGRNALVVEYACRLKAKGVKIIAITSMKHSSQIASRHASSKRLFELADIVLDNMAPYGDAGIEIDPNHRMGPISTLTGCYLSQCIMGAFVDLLIQNKKDAPVFRSSNADGADAYNKELFETYVIQKRR
ncbi:putative phosphosugar-binding protein [Faecalicoccus acidiformans]|uniref:Putative phosphosugar-binding protein n=1 Tax=Faecalicoccus acidiformans TaxID=915173 RepID=A0A7W8D1U9_9FIRM|nr:SIS domain-containing protein [Faecalicoccus acidiformans]MBB5185700.1 putative phosphosugar-binding protein [Faecalicoccus acidiformans]MBM6831218.1 SIS domain-containing protein [Faecalicoccus acidiformans]